MGLPYPGGPLIDRLARSEGADPHAFKFAKPSVPGFDYSFSGLKTSFLYFLRDRVADDPEFIEHHKTDLCASLQATIVDILMNKLVRAAKQYDITEIAVAGGVSANSGLREAIEAAGERYGWTTYIPPISLTTDNAAMIAITGYYKYLREEFADLSMAPAARAAEM